MASTEDNGEEISLSIRFVLPRGKTETTCSEDLGYAFDQAQDNGLNPSWIDEEDSLNVNPGKTVGTLLAFLLIHARGRYPILMFDLGLIVNVY